MDLKERAQKKLSELMKIHGVSNEEVAEKTGISRSSINRIRMGRGNPTIEKLLPICDFFNISLQELYEDKQIEPPEKSQFSTKNHDDLSFIPFLYWEDLTNPSVNTSKYVPTLQKNTDFLICTKTIDSLFFKEGTLLTINKKLQPNTGDLVIVRKNPQSPIFLLEYICDISGIYLKSKLSTQNEKIIRADEFKIYGVVIEATQFFKPPYFFETIN
jgi:transcriptional regulator with XRE-family HTH domain